MPFAALQESANAPGRTPTPGMLVYNQARKLKVPWGQRRAAPRPHPCPPTAVGLWSAAAPPARGPALCMHWALLSGRKKRPAGIWRVCGGHGHRCQFSSNRPARGFLGHGSVWISQRHSQNAPRVLNLFKNPNWKGTCRVSRRSGCLPPPPPPHSLLAQLGVCGSLLLESVSSPRPWSRGAVGCTGGARAAPLIYSPPPRTCVYRESRSAYLGLVAHLRR